MGERLLRLVVEGPEGGRGTREEWTRRKRRRKRRR